MSSNDIKRSHGGGHGGHHGDLSLLPDLEHLRDPAKGGAKADYDDADIYIDDRKFNEESLRPLFGRQPGYWIVVLVLSSVIAYGLARWIVQVINGLGMANIHQPVFWGIYIATFVFWVGMSHSGTIVSSILRLSMANWRRPILRGAEAMTAFSLMVAGIFPIIHVGRPWRVYYMIPLPNQRQLWPNFKSALAWDEMAISVYLTGSMVFLYIGLLPDLAFARDKAKEIGNWRYQYLRFLALGWRGGHREWAVYNKVSLYLAVTILLIAPSVHTIVSWDFATTATPGWHTTIFGPYFVVGAIYSGIAGVIMLMIALRVLFGLQDIIRKKHIDCLGQLLLVIAIIWLYFYFCEYNVVWSSQKEEELAIYEWILHRFPAMFYTMIGGTIFVIAMLGFRKVRENMVVMFLLGILVEMAMYSERYLIVVPVLSHRDNPFKWNDYIPSHTEMAIVVASFCYFGLLYAVFIKLFPIITMADVKEGVLISGDVRLGRHAVRVQVKE